MLHTCLTGITEPTDYKLALRVVDYKGEKFTKEEIEELLKLYRTYLCEVHSETAHRALLLTELTAEIGDLSTAPMGAELLGDKDLEALELLGELSARAKISAAEEEIAPLTARILEFPAGVLKTALCRVLLDKLVAWNDLGEIREQIEPLCKELTAVEDSTLYDASVVAMGVRSQWR